ncbi:hypothetical protein PILCRDRAFT_790708 [Piloderma croceum F 1598]|uniref:Uncharacterized protein n=1 Tax=Piloderma croceum (strain F 1598) TaxID=765440 RepID=A0A0C3FJB2_PILCF|nr:hypothetical protein PILCRDRAFT_790708 [Piloderma croceum F 1598]
MSFPDPTQAPSSFGDYLKSMGLHFAQTGRLNHITKANLDNKDAVNSLMMRHIPYSPALQTDYLKDTLRDLHFKKKIDKFGTFFLHDLDLEKAFLPDIAQADTDECLLAMSHVKSLKQIREKRATVTTVAVNEEGPMEHPKLLMSKWAWDHKCATRSTAGRLLLQFTTDYFLMLSMEVMNDVHLPKPKDLKGAMELWIVPSLMALLKDVSFKPSNHEDDVSSLLRALGRIFGRIQCLPNAVTCTQRSCGRLWEQSDGGIRMLTNPVFYKIEIVGKAKRKGTAQGKQVKAGKVIIKARLDEQHRNIPFNEGRLKARQVKKA